MKSILQNKQFQSIEPIIIKDNRESYKVINKDGKEMFLKVFPKTRSLRAVRATSNMMQQFRAKSISIPSPIEFGRAREGVYHLMEWIEAKLVKNSFHTMSCGQQYLLGLKAGETIRLMHSTPLKNNWLKGPGYDFTLNKVIELKPPLLTSLESCYLYVKTNMRLIENRYKCFLHGDCSTGNILYTDSDEIYIVDFGKLLHGDPWYDLRFYAYFPLFNQNFSLGILHGYFLGEPPLSFWPIGYIYASEYVINRALKTPMRRIITELTSYISDYSVDPNNTTPIPLWYTKYEDLPCELRIVAEREFDKNTTDVNAAKDFLHMQLLPMPATKPPLSVGIVKQIKKISTLRHNVAKLHCIMIP